MREILFRGKGKDNKWHYGYYINAKTHWHNRGIHEDWIVRDFAQNGGRLTVLDRYAVDGETIGQYTGLKDRNGTKIFEGDIIKGGIEETGLSCLVCFEDGEFELRYYDGDKSSALYIINAISGEVVGNIYDNPNLIEEE